MVYLMYFQLTLFMGLLFCAALRAFRALPVRYIQNIEFFCAPATLFVAQAAYSDTYKKQNIDIQTVPTLVWLFDILHPRQWLVLFTLWLATPIALVLWVLYVAYGYTQLKKGARRSPSRHSQS